MSEIDAALKILGLKPSAIKVLNVFGRRTEAEEKYTESVQKIGTNGKNITKDLNNANIELRQLDAWRTLCSERMKYHICKVCSRLTKLEHHHCPDPDCNCILQIKITWPAEDVGVERTTCQKCGFYAVRVIDNPEEVAILHPNITDTTKKSSEYPKSR